MDGAEQSMVERVARALYGAGDNAVGWESVVDEARAAIAAMREPTEAMLAILEDRMEYWDNDKPISDIYSSMIDAALAEPTAASACR